MPYAEAVYSPEVFHRTSDQALCSPFLRSSRYNVPVPTARTCIVSFIDTNGIRHAVEVPAATLYEAAVLAMAEFRRCGFTADAPGPATRLTVTVKSPSTTHEVQWGKIETWLHSRGRSPNEQAVKTRLSERLRL